MTAINITQDDDSLTKIYNQNNDHDYLLKLFHWRLMHNNLENTPRESNDKESNSNPIGKGRKRLKKIRVTESKVTGTYHYIAEDVKIKCLEELKTMTYKEVAMKYSVNEQSVKRWEKNGIRPKRKQREMFFSSDKEKKLIKWYKDQRKYKRVLTLKAFKKQAMLLVNSPEFKASNGWLIKLRRRIKPMQLTFDRTKRSK